MAEEQRRACPNCGSGSKKDLALSKKFGFACLRCGYRDKLDKK